MNLHRLGAALFVLWCGCREDIPGLPAGARVDLALQDAYGTLDLSSLGVGLGAWCMSGSALKCSYADSLLADPVAAFLGYTDGEIRAALDAYLGSHPDLDPSTSDWIILDLEHPVHPRDVGEPEYDLVRPRIVEAFRRRILIARERFPNAFLSMYGVIVGDSRGRTTARLLRSMEGYRAMAAGGVFDALDGITPVLYQRFGPDDPYFATIGAYTEAVLQESSTLPDSEGRILPLAPLLGFRVYNGGSVNSGDPADVPALRMQVGIALAHPRVARVGFWAESEEQEDYHLSTLLQQVLAP